MEKETLAVLIDADNISAMSADVMKDNGSGNCGGVGAVIKGWLRAHVGVTALLAAVTGGILGCGKGNPGPETPGAAEGETTLSLSMECAKLIAAAQESDVSIVMDSGTFCPTLYVHDGQGGSFYTLAGVDSMEALREMAASVIREKASNAKAYLLDYAAFYTHEGVRKGALIMETASRADAQATVLVFVCDRDGKKTEGPVQRPGVPSLFR